MAKLPVTTLQKIRNDQSFELFWKKVENKASLQGISEPELLCKRKVPRRFDHGTAAPEYPSSPFDHYKIIYFAGTDPVGWMGC